MRNKAGRFSGYIRPFFYIVDVLLLTSLGLFFFNAPNQEISFCIFLSLAWLVSAYHLGFYEVYRYTKVVTILNCALKQFAFFSIATMASVYLYCEDTSLKVVFYYLTSVVFMVLVLKLFIYYFLKEYRLVFGGNFRKVVILGSQVKTEQLQKFFVQNLDYGYKLVNVFSDEKCNAHSLKEVCDYLISEGVDELYCAMSDLTSDEITELEDFTDNNFKTLKFIPDENHVLSGNYIFHYYGYLPIIAGREIRLDEKLNKIIKRIFDIVFSLLVIVFILSWFTIIAAIFIKAESKGPIFFRQIRNGLKNQLFVCYKFRSMELNPYAHLNQVSKNDIRITKIGKFLRKTSLDELPQFFNVLLGDMSVVGPRPHMVSHNEKYAVKVDKFMVRHFIKPGITGLAQVRGFRGSIGSDMDMVNRIKLDIFYIENWSFILDLKIIFQTVINIFKGEENAF
ncbi:exopolysaccharide biosynthesis polyprenyl glycosylphosphotransferase [Flavobacterium crassostreae]|uniref:Undecaprenyl-phosphate glucose phosphotransferase n=1 Tax=Flavobacterium crassostreae TaxID=1763534 RepID=A0A1B9E5K3_9FLAO|nr:exopolysaccharide biosynthesis polyprenyl glycosylphosphotransferase [Flavobacterium crassostreae]OCB77217.1 undecaprenyl-phosphate glucose phosphotransferase [Flavobacterium crassostreae]